MGSELAKIVGVRTLLEKLVLEAFKKTSTVDMEYDKDRKVVHTVLSGLEDHLLE